ncbi:MAG: histidine phosphatase family protein [Pseudomonadota bacterium]
MSQSSKMYQNPICCVFALLCLFSVALCFSIVDAQAQSRAAWSALKSGKAVALLRHAKAPLRPGAVKQKGPRIVNLMDCSSQRNLSAAGRAQARRIGRAFRKRGISSARIISSAYCRTVDTARLLALGGVQTNYDINALSRPTARQQTAGFRALLRNAPSGMATILITHKSNIRALIGIGPASGETIIVTRSGRVLGRMRM